MVGEDEAVIAKLKGLFVARDDTYAKQQANGRYVRIKAPLTDDVLRLHLKGEVTVGVYQLDPRTNKVKWICTDIDPERTKDVWEASKRIYEESISLFDQKAVVFEASRYPDPSTHIWACFSSIPADAAQTIGRRVIEKSRTPEVELFPKQTDVRGGFGNLVKLPLGLHQRDKKWSRILDPNSLYPLPTEAILAVEPAYVNI